MNARIRRMVVGLCIALLPATFAFAGDSDVVRVHVSIRDSALTSGGGPAVAWSLAATCGGKVDALAIDAGGRFEMTMPRSGIDSLRRDPRAKSVEILVTHQASVSSSPGDGGAYVYDGAGNIIQIGTDRYVYDSVNRLMSASVNGTVNTQHFTYDAFGNRRTADRDSNSLGCTGSTNCESSPTISPATNQITSGGAAYDSAGAGNLTSLGSYSYAYDATA